MTQKIIQHNVPVKFRKSPIIEHADVRASYITYNDVEILHEGEYIVGNLGINVHYDSNNLDLGRWEDNWLNIDHSKNVLDRIGIVDKQWFDHQNSAVMGDLHIITTTQHGKDVVELINKGLIDKLSIELRADMNYEEEEDYYNATNIFFLGVGVVTFPADDKTRIK